MFRVPLSAELLSRVFARTACSTPQEAAAALCHALMRHHGAQLLGVEPDAQDGLPEGWNDGLAATNSLHLSYAAGEASLELKLVFMDDHVVVNVLAPTESVRTIQAELPKLLAATAPPYTDVYRIFGLGLLEFACDFGNVLCDPWSEIYKRASREQDAQQKQKPAAAGGDKPRGSAVPSPRAPSGPSSGPQPTLPTPGNPYGVGRQDLDPNFGGLPDPGGGMIVGPNHPMFGARGGLGGGAAGGPFDPFGRPPGVPPGARFDPFGPVGPGFAPRGRGGRPGNVFGEPNPDHFQPPGGFGGGGGFI